MRGAPDNSPGARAERFLASNLNHPKDSFDAVLLWDVLDYLDRDTVTRLMDAPFQLVRDGGAILAIFHTRMPEQFHRYRVLDALNLDLVSAPPSCRPSTSTRIARFRIYSPLPHLENLRRPRPAPRDRLRQIAAPRER